MDTQVLLDEMEREPGINPEHEPIPGTAEYEEDDETEEDGDETD